jgi:prepilin-type N-terminal cleavage/methylation domain-containing protein
MRATRTTSPIGPARARAPGFTLIELLIVIGIIALLIAMSVVVGARVVEGGKARSTQDIIRTLDESLGAWSFNADTPLPEALRIANPADPTGARDYIYPIIDATLDGSGTPAGFPTSPWPSATFYAALVMQDASILPMLQGIDSTFIAPSEAPPRNPKTAKVARWALPALELRDAWGRPLRIVHPTYHGGHGEYWDAEQDKPGQGDRALLGEGRTDPQTGREGIRFTNDKGTDDFGLFRRSYRPIKSGGPVQPGDADEGMCIGGTPYFYSAGEDGDPGTRGDNVYSTVPRFPVETRDFE